MGGDAFDKSLGITRLTNQQFLKQTSQISNLISAICIRAQIYTPMPQKQSHGDIDFLVILKPNYTPIDLAHAIKSKQHIISKCTINCIYNNHQVDFKTVANNEQFQMTKFYKSYSGVGYILGYFTYKNNIKFSEHGLYVFQRQVVGNVKLEYLITNNVEEICGIYGVSYEDYQKGFETRDELMMFLASSRYFDLKRILETNPKDVNKLYAAFKQFCQINKETLAEKSCEMGEDMFEQLLDKFGKLQEYNIKVKNLIQQANLKRNLQEKFNGGHIEKIFGLHRKEIGDAKKKFLQSFSSQQAYEKFILESQSQTIISQFKRLVIQAEKKVQQI